MGWFGRCQGNYDTGAWRRGVTAMLGRDQALTRELVQGLPPVLPSMPVRSASHSGVAASGSGLAISERPASERQSNFRTARGAMIRVAAL